MNDPYKVLGIARDATDEEIKKAYRELAKKYHPDNYANGPLSDLAAEKMKEINEAYDTIQKERAGGGGGRAGYEAYGAGYTGSYDKTSYFHVRRLINEGRYAEAELILDAKPAESRNAEWNYLKGCILLRRGWYFDAQKYIETACYMDPQNAEYRNARLNLQYHADRFGRGYRRAERVDEASVCNFCAGLLCADCLCECCGGDLIRCC